MSNVPLWQSGLFEVTVCPGKSEKLFGLSLSRWVKQEKGMVNIASFGDWTPGRCRIHTWTALGDISAECCRRGVGRMSLAYVRV